MELFDRFLAAETAFFAAFGYHPQKSRYPERHPVIDCRGCYWLLAPGDPPSVCWSATPLSGLRLEIGTGIRAASVLTWLGANRKTGRPGGHWRGPGHTLIATGVPPDGERRYLLFSDANECRDPFLVNLARVQCLA